MVVGFRVVGFVDVSFNVCRGVGFIVVGFIVGTLVGDLVGAFVGDLVGYLVGYLVGASVPNVGK